MVLERDETKSEAYQYKKCFNHKEACLDLLHLCRRLHSRHTKQACHYFDEKSLPQTSQCQLDQLSICDLVLQLHSFAKIQPPPFQMSRSASCHSRNLERTWQSHVPLYSGLPKWLDEFYPAKTLSFVWYQSCVGLLYGISLFISCGWLEIASSYCRLMSEVLLIVQNVFGSAQLSSSSGAASIFPWRYKSESRAEWSAFCLIALNNIYERSVEKLSGTASTYLINLWSAVNENVSKLRNACKHATKYLHHILLITKSRSTWQFNLCCHF